MRKTINSIGDMLWRKHAHAIKGFIGFSVIGGFIALIAYYSPEQINTRKAISLAIQAENELYGKSKYDQINTPYNRTAKDGVYASKDLRVHKGRYGYFVWCRDVACGTINVKASIFDLENKLIGNLADSKRAIKGEIVLMLPFASTPLLSKADFSYIQLTELKIDGRNAF